MKILYRITDGGNNKIKQEMVYNKKLMFIHFTKIFKKHEIYVFADNVNDETYKFIQLTHPNVIRLSLGNGGSFVYCMDYAIKNFKDQDNIYFAEDDYIYKAGSAELIEEGLSIADYVSGYDHPDKYLNYNEGGPNPLVEHGGELTRLLITEHLHWKLTNSTCMTFATTVKRIKQDYAIFAKNCNGNLVGDFGIFRELYDRGNMRLISAVPSLCTHGETDYLAKFVNWDHELLKSFQ